MDDNSSNDKMTEEELKKYRAEKTVAKLTAIKAARKYDKQDSKWTLVQELLQEVIATHVVENPSAKPYIKVISAELREEIRTRFSDDPEKMDVLLGAVPADSTIQNQWLKKEGWEDAVWGKVRSSGCGIFNKERRAAVVNALYERAINKSDNAAKIWLTLSGDYSEKVDGGDKNKTLEAYREINELLHKKPTS